MPDANEERRSSRRFPIPLDLTCKSLAGGGLAAAGRIVNISRGGVLFRIAETPAPGAPVLLTVSWPVLLNSNVPLKLMLYGVVLRVSEGEAAVAIGRYEFRTARTPQLI